MRIPAKNIGPWARELIGLCSASRVDRIQRGTMYKNFYLTGDENGDPAIYPKTFSYIDTTSSYLYSPVDLNFNIRQFGGGSPIDRAKNRAAGNVLLEHIRESGADTEVGEAVTWALVKGKSFLKTLWSRDGLEVNLIQPEMMGVLEENKKDLNSQEAFFQSIYITPEQFMRRINGHPNQAKLTKNIQKYINPTRDSTDPYVANSVKQVILGGLYPYQASGSGAQPGARGVVDWLNSPTPQFAPKVLSKIIRLDELWVWDDETDDWTTIQIVGDDCVVEGETFHRNIFADPIYTAEGEKDPDNPLKGKHPYVEFCPNRLDGYFWGRSEICNVGLLQKSINTRINGINMLLRLQEKPPRMMSGSSSINQIAYAKLNKPGGYIADSNPNAKMQSLAPELPPTLYESLHETLQWFNDMAGMAPVLQGQGESGVRAQGHAETLVRTASPRFKDRALTVERQIEELGGLILDMLKAHYAEQVTAWVMPSDGGIQAQVEEAIPGEDPPALGMKPIRFLMAQLPQRTKVTVATHSSSPAFSHDTEQKMYTLAKLGAVSPQTLVEQTHPPGEDDIIADIERKEIQQAQFAAQHPEAVTKGHGPGKKR